MTDWQPIETAPKDAERILLFDAMDEDRTVDLGQWLDAELIGGSKSGWVPSDGIHTEKGGACLFCSPTHWMPLPEPPKA